MSKNVDKKRNRVRLRWLEWGPSLLNLLSALLRLI